MGWQEAPLGHPPMGGRQMSAHWLGVGVPGASEVPALPDSAVERRDVIAALKAKVLDRGAVRLRHDGRRERRGEQGPEDAAPRGALGRGRGGLLGHEELRALGDRRRRLRGRRRRLRGRRRRQAEAGHGRDDVAAGRGVSLRVAAELLVVAIQAYEFGGASDGAGHSTNLG